MCVQHPETALRVAVEAGAVNGKRDAYPTAKVQRNRRLTGPTRAKKEPLPRKPRKGFVDTLVLGKPYLARSITRRKLFIESKWM